MTTYILRVAGISPKVHLEGTESLKLGLHSLDWETGGGYSGKVQEKEA